MANRRLARGSRGVQKKKLKAAKKETFRAPAKSAVAEVAARGGATRKSFYTGGGAGLRGNAGTGSGHMKLSAKLRARVSAHEEKVAAVRKRRSALRRQQQVERMTLKEHTAELERRRESIRRGDSAKQERRELGKYIRQLREEQVAKHAAELAEVEAELQQLADEEQRERDRHQPPKKRGAKGYQVNEEPESGDWVDVHEIDSDESIDEAGIQDMFAHLIA